MKRLPYVDTLPRQDRSKSASWGQAAKLFGRAFQKLPTWGKWAMPAGALGLTGGGLFGANRLGYGSGSRDMRQRAVDAARDSGFFGIGGLHGRFSGDHRAKSMEELLTRPLS